MQRALNKPCFQALGSAVLQQIRPIIEEVMKSVPAEAVHDPAAVRQAWLDNMGKSVGGEAAVGPVVAGKIKGQLALRMSRSTPRLLTLSPADAAASDPADLHLTASQCLPVEVVLRTAASNKTGEQLDLLQLQKASMLQPKASSS